MDTELTELVEIDPTRLDGVKSPANGLPFLIMKSTAKDVKGKKLNEEPDISCAEEVLRLLGQLIQSEARELQAGFWDEVCDIQMLADAARTIKYFRANEQLNAESAEMTKSLEDAVSRRAIELGVPDPMSDESASKDTTTTTETEPTTETAPVTETKPVEKSVDELVTEAVAKAMTERDETIKGLRDEMAALKATQIPGGPVITAPVVKTEMQHRHAADIARFDQLAKSVQDRELARYYADRAAELRSQN